jgi:DNA-binding Lrp family transcriptional regulator
MVSAIGIVIDRPAKISACARGSCRVLARRAISGKRAWHGARPPLDRRVFPMRAGIHLARRRYTGKTPFSETTAMVPFFVQFKCKLGQSYAVANAIAEAEIASEIYSTAGDYDLLVKFYVDNDTDIGHFVNEKVQTIPGIQDTHTIITFKAFGPG